MQIRTRNHLVLFVYFNVLKEPSFLLSLQAKKLKDKDCLHSLLLTVNHLPSTIFARYV